MNVVTAPTHQGEPGARRSDPLLQPLRIKRVLFRNRIMSTSHASTLDEDGMPKERYQRYHEEKAKGGIALTMFGGSSMVSRDSSWGGGQIDVSGDAIIPYLRQFSARIHGHGAAIMCQISHLGRRADAMGWNWLPTHRAIAACARRGTAISRARWTRTISRGWCAITPPPRSAARKVGSTVSKR